MIYELVQHEHTTATTLGGELNLDAGYLSRILRGFARRGPVEKQPSATDGRQSDVRLTEQGQQMFALLNLRSRDQVAALLQRLPPPNGARRTSCDRTRLATWAGSCSATGC